MSPDIVKGSSGGRIVPSEELMCYGVTCDPAVLPPFPLCQAYHHWEACSLANISMMPHSWGLGLSVLCYLALLIYLWWLAKFLSNSKVTISVWLQTLPPDLWVIDCPTKARIFLIASHFLCMHLPGLGAAWWSRKSWSLESNRCCCFFSPAISVLQVKAPSFFPEVSLCSNWPSAFQKS